MPKFLIAVIAVALIGLSAAGLTGVIDAEPATGQIGASGTTPTGTVPPPP